MLGDLREEFAARCRSGGALAARRWFRSQVLRSVGYQLETRIRDLHEGLKGGGMLGGIGQDFRQGWRGLRRYPWFAAVVIVTMAVGIGANSLIFSVVDSLVFRPFPFPEPDRLVAVGTEYPRLNRPLNFVEHLSPAEYLDLRDETSTLERAVAWDMGNRQIATEQEALNVFTGFWWGDAFPTLGVSASLGRGFSDEEIREGQRVAVLSHRLWVNRFGSDPTILGRSLEITGNPYTVVGVMPEGTLLYGMDLWMPMPVGPEVYARDRRQFQVIARIRDGATMTNVVAELEGLARRTEREYGAEFEEYQGFRFVPATWTDANVRQFRTASAALLGAVGFVLLLVCANMASLLLARSSNRGREIAVRTALGARRWRLVRQLLVESVVLAVLGGILGVGLAYVGVEQVRLWLDGVPFVSNNVSVRPLALFYTLALSAGAGLVFGIVPALHASRTSIQGSLSAESGSTGSRSRLRLQRWFVGVEVALAVVLLVGGGLLTNSFLRLNSANPGFDHENVLTMRLTLPWDDYAGGEFATFFEGLAERTRSVPGVVDATVGTQFPPISFSRGRIAIEGQDAVEEGQLPVAFLTQAGDRYFETLGIDVLRGRGPGPDDRADGVPVAVVNQVFADRFFPGLDPIGRKVRLAGDQDSPWFEVVGVAESVRNRGMTADPQPEVFASVRQLSGTNNQLFLLLRTSVPPMTVLPAVRSIVQEFDSDQPIYAIRTLEEILSGQSAPNTAAAMSMGTFAVFALLLAALGIYSVVAFSVGERTKEIGLRLALGAPPKRVQALMARQTLVPVVLGGFVGVVGSLFVSRGLESLLYEVQGGDPTTTVVVVGLLALVSFSACWLPARRALAVDPAQSLREG